MRTGNVLEALKFKHPRKLHNCLWNIVSILPGGLHDAPDLLQQINNINIYLEEFGQGSVEEKDGLVETMAESGELEYEWRLRGSEGYSLACEEAGGSAERGWVGMCVIPTTVWFCEYQ